MNEIVIEGIPARYVESKIQRYKGNPLIECLPEILTEEKILRLFFNIETVTDYERSQDFEVRNLMTESLRDFLVPASVHVQVGRAVYQMICNGYVNRNPLSPGRKKPGEQRSSENGRPMNSRNYPEVRPQRGSNSPITKMFIGVSGMGKTTCIDQILDYFPQVIAHSDYNGKPFTRTQITYLKVSCPSNASPDGFCLDILKAFDRALNTRQFEYSLDKLAYGKERLKDDIEKYMEIYHVGLLVIDDINHLIKNNHDAQELKELFTSLIDIWNVPIIFIGTPLAQELLQTNYTGIRRFNSEGTILWDRMSKDSTDWEVFVTTIWRMQYTKTFTPLTEELSQALYDASQGITSLAISIFRLTQQYVILDGNNTEEVLTVSSIEKTVQQSFSAYQDLISAIKNDDFRKLSEYEDLIIDIHNFDLSSPDELELINPSRIAELQKKIIQEDRKDLVTVLYHSLMTDAEAFPHLEEEDFLKIVQEVISLFPFETKEAVLKREIWQEAIALENQREVQEEKLRLERLKEEQKLEENRKNTKDNRLIKLFHKAQKEKKSVYDIYSKEGLTGFGIES